jgi:hypothetical protein
MHLLVGTLNERGPEKLLRSSNTSTILDCWASSKAPVYPRMDYSLPLSFSFILRTLETLRTSHPDQGFTQTKAHHTYCYTPRRRPLYPPLRCSEPSSKLRGISPASEAHRSFFVTRYPYVGNATNTTSACCLLGGLGLAMQIPLFFTPSPHLSQLHSSVMIFEHLDRQNSDVARPGSLSQLAEPSLSLDPSIARTSTKLRLLRTDLGDASADRAVQY